MSHHKQIMLVGNPNSGKTTLFNALTGANQRVGNWPGVTVEKKSGDLVLAKERLELIDLPGLYTLDMNHVSGLDEKLAADVLLKQSSSLILNVVDATNLQRHLYLTVQLLERGLPVVVILTMADLKKAPNIDIPALSKALGVPVLDGSAKKSDALTQLKELLSSQWAEHCSPLHIPYSAPVEQLLTQIGTHFPLVERHAKRGKGLQVLQGELTIESSSYHPSQLEEADIEIADGRYGFVHQVCQRVIQTPKESQTSQWLDKLVLNRWLGGPIFLLVMYAMFFFAINVGGAFQDCFDILSSGLFVDGMASLCHQIGLPNAITAIVAYGLGKGLNTVFTFIPVLAAMYFFLAFLEGSGYMARAAFVVDRLMRMIGLPGKAFVPLIVGFGCNVPAVMSTRTLNNERDRVLSAMMAPFMSCSARLAIFTVFVSLFFPTGGHNIIFGLYMLGIFAALFTAYILKNTLVQSELSPLMMELPHYHLPVLSHLFYQTWSRLKQFVIRAGKVIVPVSILLGSCNVLTFSGGLESDGGAVTILSLMGRALTPIFAPMGISADNWQAVVGLLMGTVAKEVVIATLNTLYAAHSWSTQVSFDFWDMLTQAWQSIPDNLAALVHALGSPLSASMPEQSLSNAASSELINQFNGGASATAYLIFVLLYVPCISTMAVLKKELNGFWMGVSVVWSTVVAYTLAVVFYQFATLQIHFLSSMLYIFAMFGVLTATLLLAKSRVAMFYSAGNMGLGHER